MEPDACMRDKGDHCEHTAVYTDNLLINSKDPKSIISILSAKHKFELKGTGPMCYHLGCDFGQDKDGTLCFTPKKCVEKMEECFFNMFGSKPKTNYMDPL